MQDGWPRLIALGRSAAGRAAGSGVISEAPVPAGIGEIGDKYCIVSCGRRGRNLYSVRMPWRYTPGAEWGQD
jgi:hypothetical protein